MVLLGLKQNQKSESFDRVFAHWQRASAAAQSSLSIHKINPCGAKPQTSGSLKISFKPSQAKQEFLCPLPFRKRANLSPIPLARLILSISLTNFSLTSRLCCD
jgi:hypothetical protein